MKGARKKEKSSKPDIKLSEKKNKKTKSKYDEKIVVDASFEELMKELITPKLK